MSHGWAPANNGHTNQCLVALMQNGNEIPLQYDVTHVKQWKQFLSKTKIDRGDLGFKSGRGNATLSFANACGGKIAGCNHT
eukprot:6889635-Lingulodinium_polyedra.AAC.1